MSDIDAEIATLKNRIAEAEKAKMLADLKFQSAQQRVLEASRILKEKYGVESLEDARTYISKLRKEIDSKRAEIEKLMDKFEEAK